MFGLKINNKRRIEGREVRRGAVGGRVREERVKQKKMSAMITQQTDCSKKKMEKK